MVQQDTAQALLAAVLAVNEGMVAPNSAAAVLAETVTMRGRDWFQMLVQWQLADQTKLEILKSQLAEKLSQHNDDVEEALRQTAIDARLRRELDRFQLPQLRALMQLSPEESQSIENTSTGDRYDTMPSQRPDESGAKDDPYTTSRVPVSIHFDSEAESRQSGHTESGASTGVSAVSDSNAVNTPAPAERTHPEQRVIKSESILEVQPADYATQAPATPGFVSLNESTVPPKGDYATLKSEIPIRIERQGRHAPEDDDSSQTQRFRVLREHAKGGLGKVSVAEDLELHREVAFKEIQRRYSSDLEARARFLLEAEITGGLEHPGIVPVYGLGTHTDGRPYYAMRFIRGRTLQQGIEQYYRSIKQGTDAGALQIEFRQLLRRFTDVCNAIEYAHNRGIIHRDIKPGNIMLGDYGETLVVDWGIAKSVNVPGSLFKASLVPLQPKMGSDASQTVMGVAIGTPQFMSPEQASGKLDELGPASDIYSLGATLYCLLTGAAAFTSREVDTVLNQVKSGTFPAPRTVNPQVPKPLNAICLKAMALQPALRYQSARALAEDIEHWLADEPVVAYQDDRWEQASRWVRHHQARAQAIAVSVVVIAVVSIVAAFLIDQSRRAEAEALRKQKEANAKEIAARQAETKAKQKALLRSRDTREAIDTLLVGVSDALLEAEVIPGMQEARKRLLMRAVADYVKLSKEESTDPGLQLEAGRSMLRLGDVYVMLNDIEKARETFERVTVATRGHGDDVPASNFNHLNSLAKIQLSNLEIRAGNRAKAVKDANDAIALLRTLTAESKGRLDFQVALGNAQLVLGKALLADGKLSAAASQLQQALLLFQGLRKQNPKDAAVLSATAAAEATFARYLFDESRSAEAVRMFEQAIATHDALLTEFPDTPDYLGHRATAYIGLADALRFLGEWQRVVGNDQASVEDLRQVSLARPDIPKHRENLAVARQNLGQSLRRLGRSTDAIPILEKAIEDFNDLSLSYRIPQFVQSLGNARTSLAQILSELGQQDKALELINLAVEDYQQLLELQPQSVDFMEGMGITQRNRGRILARRGDLMNGVQALEESIKLLQTASDKQPKVGRIIDHIAWSWWTLGQIQLAAGKTEEAHKAFKEALDIRQKLIVSFKDQPQFRDTLAWQLATCPADDLRNLKRALELTRTTINSFASSTQFLFTRGAVLLLNDKALEASTELQKSVALRGADDGLTLCFLALSAAKQKLPDEAQKHLAAAKAFQQAQKPADEELAYWIKQAEAAVMAK